ncbi:MAG TPA: SRPBCC domain-containing protein [Acidobacteriaceae bacterium]|jgi:uncharacterized protein YndB with AHSA1/START domain
MNACLDLSLQFNQLIPAPSARVFDAWTDPDLLKTWFAPGNMTVPRVRRDLRPGGAYRIEMQGVAAAAQQGSQPQAGEDAVVVAEGIYTMLVPGQQLSYTWAGSWNPAEESHVTVSLSEDPRGTALTLDHYGFHSEQSLAMHRSSWKSSLSKLRELLCGN